MHHGGVEDNAGGAHPAAGELPAVHPGWRALPAAQRCQAAGCVQYPELRGIQVSHTQETHLEIPRNAQSFRDVVDAAHLRPVTRSDKANASTKNRLWNSAARD